MDPVNFLEHSLPKIWRDIIVCLSRPYPFFKFFKTCLPQILLGPFLNALYHLKICESQKKTWVYPGTVWKTTKYGIFSGLYLDIFYAVWSIWALFETLVKRRPNKCCLWEVDLVSRMQIFKLMYQKC